MTQYDPLLPFLTPRIGLGCWRLAGPGRPPWTTAVATVAAAYEAGVRLFDTADCYCLDDDDHGYGETLLAEALTGVTDAVIVTKGGYRRPQGVWRAAGSAASVRAAIEASVERLGRPPECYLLHGLDPQHPLEESLEPIVAAVETGLVASLGVSNVTAADLARSRLVAPVRVVQNRLSVTVRPPGWREVLDDTLNAEASYMAHTPFGPTSEEPGTDSLMWNSPRVRAIAERHEVSAAAVALAWIISLGGRVVVTPGARRPESIVDSWTATSVKLTDAELQTLSALAG